MVRAQPRFPFSRDYNFISDGKLIGEFRVPWIIALSKSGRFTLAMHGKTYFVNPPYLMISTLGHAESKLTLVEDDRSVAFVEYPQVNNSDMFFLGFDKRKLEVKRTSKHVGGYLVSEGNAQIGEVRLPNILLRGKTVQLPDDIPLVVQALTILGTIYTPKVNVSV